MTASGRAVTATLVAVFGVLTGLRAVLALSVAGAVPLLQPLPVPLETLGIDWSDAALWPADVQGAALTRLLGTVGGLVLAVASVAMLNVVMLLAEGASARRAEIAVHSALGASPGRLALTLLRELRTAVIACTTLGLSAGLAAGLALRLTWPGSLESVLSRPPFELALMIAGALGVALLAHAGTALSGLRRGRSVDALRSGSRATADPAALFARRVLSAVHVSVAAAVLVNAWALASPRFAGARAGIVDDVAVVRAERDDPAEWAALAEALRAIPELDTGSLATPGAILGLGIRDITITECGNCSIGMMPAPLWNATSEHHAVGPGFFDTLGIEVLQGRTFTASDDTDGAPVAVVSRRLANVAFENGEPLGKRLRVGDDLDRWYTVVGVVEDYSRPVLGEDAIPRGAVYLSALQRPPRVARVLLKGTNAAVEAAEALIEAPAEPLATFLRREAAPLRWSARVVLVLGALALILAVHGIWLTALQTTRRRAPELAVRRALGATSPALARLVVGERLRIAAWGVAGFAFLGTLASAPLQRAAGLSGPGLPGFAAVAVLLVAASLLASGKALAEALAVEPKRLLD